ncbi:MAG TPA: MFS transporter [Vicinamibacterales bacterium]|jgi:UMF1 family MFS transporter
MALAERLKRLGLDRPDLRAWALYDWANSAFQTTIIAAVFPIYYAEVAARDLAPPVATSRFMWGTAIAIIIVAIVAPILGAIADYRAVKKQMLAAFLAIGVTATAAMYFIGPGDWSLALRLFVVGNVGVAGSIVFYESLLPHLVPAGDDEALDRVSSAGYAIGYLGGGVLLAINVLMILKPSLFGIPDVGTATRLTFVSVAIWWAVFSIPLFVRVPEPKVGGAGLQTGSTPPSLMHTIGVAFARLGTTFRELRRYRQAFLLLLAFLIYNDGIQTMIRAATIYGTEIGLNTSVMIMALLLTQFIGVPCAFMFGRLAGRIGPKRAVFIGLLVYAGITVLGYFMSSGAHFLALAVLVGTVQGGTQALSRSMFASMIPRDRSSEFFAFFSVFERYAGILGPVLFAWTISATGAGRNAILAVLAFFVIGAAILSRVDVEEGRREATQPASVPS